MKPYMIEAIREDARDAEFSRCCKVLCPLCATGIEVYKDLNQQWRHRNPPTYCAAHKLRNNPPGSP